MRDQPSTQSIGRRGWLAEVAAGLLAVGVTGAAPAAARPAWAVLAGGMRPDESGGPSGATVSEYAVETTVRLPPQNPFGREETDVRAYVLVRGGEAVLVDALTPGNAGLIGEALAAAGLGWDALRHVILTHAHPDHAGSAADVLVLAPRATAWIAAAEAHLVQLPRSSQPLADGDEVAGLRIVATPGHSPGHVSVLDAAGSTAIVGDAAHNVGGAPGLIGPPFTSDAARAAASLARLAALDFRRALFAHGPAIETRAASALAAVVDVAS
jgi:glyoxylase-like metal-dependent hydrolase (beta-lactamase superfamily II)